MTLEESISWLCAPTLCQLKAGTLLYWRFHDEDHLLSSLRRLNLAWAGQDICAIPLNLEQRCPIYCFRPTLLQSALLHPGARMLLQTYGYPPQAHISQQLTHLRRRMTGAKGFPHEMGLFLGYPPEDVASYLQGNQPCLLTGFWQVYHDAEHAAAQFARMRRCMVHCRARWAAGETLAMLCGPST